MIGAERRLLLLGAGGHAKVVASTAQAAGMEVVAAFDDDRLKWGTEILGVPVRGELAAAGGSGIDSAVIAIGDNAQRSQVAQSHRFRWVTLVHPRAWVHPSVRLGEGTVVFAGAIIQPDSSVGKHVIVNTGATVDHDCVIGDLAHVCPGVSLGGSVVVGNGALLGVGSAALPGTHLGAWCTLGAGGLAAGDLPDRCVAIGVPARPRGSQSR